jgi:hypothetical protein
MQHITTAMAITNTGLFLLARFRLTNNSEQQRISGSYVKSSPNASRIEHGKK